MQEGQHKRLGIGHVRLLIQRCLAAVDQHILKGEDIDQAQCHIFKDMLTEAEYHSFRNQYKGTKSPRVSAPMDRNKVMSIKLRLATNPNVSNKQLAELMNIQAGRISEVRAGKYDYLMSKDARAPLARHDEPLFKYQQPMKKTA